MTDNLPELRDIHLPEGVSLFPPAYGWWIILFGLLALVIIWKLSITLRKKSKKIYALKLLSNINTNNILPAAVEVSEVLRRICIYKYPEANALFGKGWIVFLNNHSKNILSQKAEKLLIDAPYIPPNSPLYTKSDIEELNTFAQRWIGENL